jgi:hypothetical protein
MDKPGADMDIEVIVEIPKGQRTSSPARSWRPPGGPVARPPRRRLSAAVSPLILSDGGRGAGPAPPSRPSRGDEQGSGKLSHGPFGSKKFSPERAAVHVTG